jgi:hypothetical protein
MVGETMKLTNRNVVSAFQTLTQIGNMPLDPKAAYWMGRNWKQLKPLWEKVEKGRAEIIKKHGTVDPNNPNNLFVPPMIEVESVAKEIEVDGKMVANPSRWKPNPAVELCTADLEDLVDQEVEAVIMKIKLSAFKGHLTFQNAEALDFMLEEDNESNLITFPR